MLVIQALYSSFEMMNANYPFADLSAPRHAHVELGAWVE